MKLSEMKDEKEKKSADGESHDNLEKESEKLANLSNDELFDKLRSEVARQKNEGTFDFQALTRNLEIIRPFMSEQAFQNLMGVVEKLK